MGGGFVCMQHNYCSAFIVTELLCILYMNDILALLLHQLASIDSK